MKSKTKKWKKIVAISTRQHLPCHFLKVWVNIPEKFAINFVREEYILQKCMLRSLSMSPSKL
jgi:hypothetical protein